MKSRQMPPDSSKHFMQTLLTSPADELCQPRDQARELRALVARRARASADQQVPVRRCRTIAVAGGKGGVGRSVVALNLAIAFAKQGAAVGLVDASPDLGSIQMLCGLNSYWNLSHVAQGSRRLGQVVQQGPEGVSILSGASVLGEPDSHSHGIQNRLIEPLVAFENQLDWLIVDASCGQGHSMQHFAVHADDVLIMTTPEPTAVAEAYASVKSLLPATKPRLGLLVNQADSMSQAQRILDRLQQAARSFLNLDFHRRGYIPRDPMVAHSVQTQSPFAVATPECDAAVALQQLAQRWTRPPSKGSETNGFFRDFNKSEGAK